MKPTTVNFHRKAKRLVHYNRGGHNGKWHWFCGLLIVTTHVVCFHVESGWLFPVLPALPQLCLVL